MPEAVTRFVNKYWRVISIVLLGIMISTTAVQLYVSELSTSNGYLPEKIYFTVVADSICSILLAIMYFSCFRSRIVDRVTVLFMLLVAVTHCYVVLDEISWVADGVAQYRTMSLVVNYIVFLCPVALSWLFWHFIHAWINVRSLASNVATFLINTFTVLDVIILASNIWGGFIFTISPDNVYARSGLYLLSVILPSMSFVICAVRIFMLKMNWRDKLILLLYPSIPYGLMLVSLGRSGPLGTSVGLFIAVFLMYSTIFVRHERELRVRDAELMDARVNLMVSQIQPHFVSNTLGMIRSLYRTSPQVAEGAMTTFISYLQKNFSDLSNTAPIPFERELEHVRQFMEIEQLRWPDICTEYDIAATSFSLPAMTLQPLVENAVRHGLMPLKRGGTITIASAERDDAYTVTVTDNGVGFDVNDPKPQYDDHRRHIGLTNVRDRVETISRGTLDVESTPGAGTRITVTIPKEVKL